MVFRLNLCNNFSAITEGLNCLKLSLIFSEKKLNNDINKFNAVFNEVLLSTNICLFYPPNTNDIWNSRLWLVFNFVKNHGIISYFMQLLLPIYLSFHNLRNVKNNLNSKSSQGYTNCSMLGRNKMMPNWNLLVHCIHLIIKFHKYNSYEIINNPRKKHQFKLIILCLNITELLQYVWSSDK